MSACCDATSLAKQLSQGAETCPGCRKKGKSVSLETVKAMLSVSLDLVHSTNYHFCTTETCPVVYFAADGLQVFTKVDMREQVHQKAPLVDEVFVCYCFRYTPLSLRKEVATSGRSTAIASITAGIQAGKCACEIRNPQGSCCLGNVKAVLHQIVDPALIRSQA